MLPILLAAIIWQYRFSRAFSQGYVCPGNVMHFDLKPCNPTERNQCPENFACRRSRLSRAGTTTNEVIHLCCEAVNMTIASWLEELELSPQIIPQPPPSTLDYVHVTNYDAEHPSPIVHLGSELQAFNYPNYVTANVQAFKFQSAVPASGGYLHVITLIDAAKRPAALFISYDLRSEGYFEVNIENATDRMHRFFGYVGSGSVPQQDTYRQQYVVLIYKTEIPLSSQANVTADVTNFVNQIPYFLSSSGTGRSLGNPIAGIFFYVTSRRTLFEVQPSYGPVRPYSAGCSTTYQHSISFLLICILRIIQKMFV